MYISDIALDRALNAMCGLQVEIALMHGDNEETDRGYSRQLAIIGMPMNGERVNQEDIVFEPYMGDARSPVDGWAVFEGGNLVMQGDMTRARTPEAGDQVVLAAGTIRIGLGVR